MEAPGAAGPILRPHCPRCLQQLVRAPNVRVDERIRTMNRSIDVGLGGEMHDGVDAFSLEDVPHRIAVPDVTLHKCESLVLGDRLQTRHVSGVGKRVQADDFIGRVLLHPELDEVAADEAGRACYKHSTHRE